jgi:hypothetical protein
MSESERYTKHYINTLNTTITETLLRSLQLQANAKFVDELVGELNQENEALKTQVQEMGEKIIELHKKEEQYNAAIQQVSHLETFRNELLRERKDHDVTRSLLLNLEKEFDNLQDLNNKIVAEQSARKKSKAVVKDGGKF